VTLGLCLPRSCEPAPVRQMLGTLFDGGAQPLAMQRTMDIVLTLVGVRGIEDNSDWLLSFKFIATM